MPQSAARKFLFDLHSFEGEGTSVDVVAVEEAPPPPPTFSEEDLAAARAEGVAEGRASTLEEVKTTEAAAASRALEATRVALTVLAEGEADRATLYETASIRLALATFAKAFPALAAARGLGEIRTAIEGALADLGPHVGEVTLHAHPDHLPALGALGVHLHPDEALGLADFRAAWAGGGAARDAGAVAETVAAALARGLQTGEDGAHG